MAKRTEPTPLKLEPGHFYRSRGGDVWCCLTVRLKDEEHFQAYCAMIAENMANSRTEYFYADGRYNDSGSSQHTLIEEVSGPYGA